MTSLFVFVLKLLFLLVLLYSNSASTHNEPIIYKLTISSKEQDRGYFSADTSHLNQFTLLPPRSFNQQSEPNLAIECVKNSKTKSITFGEAINCEQIKWQVSFRSADNHDTDLSKQSNFYSGEGWWVLFEWDQLPRINSNDEITVCANIIRTQQNKCHPLPNINQPPLIFIFGQSASMFELGKQSINVYTDTSGKTLLNNENISSLIKQYHYIMSLFVEDAPKLTTIDLAWVGISKEHQVLGGAAGVSSYVSNYIIEDERVTTESQKRLFWITGHETFHMLTPYQYPLWMSESLAHYYGYKSLTQTTQPNKDLVSQWEINKSKFPFADTGLYQAHKKVSNDHNMMYYPLFYEKGAAFWQELDNHLQKKNHSLDQILPLLAQSTDHNGRFRTSLIKTLEQLIGTDEIETLLLKYL